MEKQIAFVVMILTLLAVMDFFWTEGKPDPPKPFNEAMKLEQIEEQLEKEEWKEDWFRLDPRNYMEFTEEERTEEFTIKARTWEIVGVKVEGRSFWWCDDQWVEIEEPCGELP